MTANRGPKRANRTRAAAAGQTYTQVRQARLTPPADQADDYNDDVHIRQCEGCHWLLDDDYPRCPNGCDDYFDRKRAEEYARRWATEATRRYQEAPVPADVFLEHVRAHPDLMPAAPTTFAGEDIGVRRNWGLPCLRCGQPAANAYVAIPATSQVPRWLDLCPECTHATGVYEPTRDMATTYGQQG
ncbi:hypothetical protein [Peterkaempfera griseoplana]|uniref:hypothetical protein n=1 Tax=Peterkaempfera griseoplana TaxID=66896 RepID=UPI0006E1B8C9|nr:hypothetical protein [Peterkaempfera griseoplana]